MIAREFDFEGYQNKFIRYLKRKNYSAETINGYDKDLNKFRRYLYEVYHGAVFVDEISKNDILDYIDFLKEEEGLKWNSISKYISTLRSFFRYLVQELHFSENPAANIPSPKFYTPLPQVLDQEEVKRLLETAKSFSNFYYVLLSFLYYTGTRITAARTLRKEHVDLKNEKVYFPYIKGGRDLYVPIHPTLLVLLREFLQEHRHNGSPYVFQSPRLQRRPISASDIRMNLRKIVRASKIEKRVTPHILRHSLATHLTLLQVNQAYIAEILGHVDLRSTARYQHLSIDNLRPELGKLV